MAPRLTARLSEEARRGWDQATYRHGSTLTALIESLGRSLDERSWDLPAEVVELAQRIDRERYSRR